MDGMGWKVVEKLLAIVGLVVAVSAAVAAFRPDTFAVIFPAPEPQILEVTRVVTATSVPANQPVPSEVTKTVSVPTSTPIPTTPPTPIDIDTAIVLFRDDFSDTNRGWQRIKSYEDETYYKNGEMVVLDSAQRKLAQPSARPFLSFNDFIVQLDSRWSGGAVGGRWGLLFRFQDWDNYYRFLIGNDGRFEIAKVANGTWVTLADGFSNAIDRNGGQNNIQIEANSRFLKGFVNGQPIFDISDIEHDNGDIVLIGIGPEVGYSDVFFEVSFDNLVVAAYE